MTTAVNQSGVSHAHSLVAAGKINNGSWDFSAADGDSLLGPNGDDWSAYSQWFLAIHPSETKNTKAYYGYPFGKGGEIYRNAVSSAKGRAAQQGATAVEAACSSLLDEMDKKKSGPVMKRAYATFDVKAVTEAPDGRMYFEGIASTPTPDRMGDVVEPKGAQFKLPMPFLYQHDTACPIGQITDAKVTPSGIKVKGYVEGVQGPPTLKERLDVAKAELKLGLIRGLSIGFNPLDYEPIKNTLGYLYKLWEWLELSMVTIAANQEATITTIKSIDKAQQRAALGTARNVVTLNPPPGATGSKSITGNKMKPITEQLVAFENKRAACVARMEEIMSKAAEDGATLEAELEAEYDGLGEDVKKIDAHIVRLKAHEATVVAKAVAVTVDAGKDADAGSAARQGQQKGQQRDGGGRIVMGNHRLEKATAFTRYAMALAHSKGNIMLAAEIAKQWKDSTPEVEQICRYAMSQGGTDFLVKGAIAAGNTTDTTWAAPLVQYVNMASEFVELLYPLTILGRMKGLRMVPFNIRFPTQTAGATVGWVGQNIAKPVSKLAFSSTTLGFAKAAGIVVVTTELAKLSSPAAEGLVRTDLLNTMAQFEDKQFIDPGVAAVANVSPASITNGLTAVQSTGATRALIDVDVASLFAGFLTANLSLAGATWVMTPFVALKLSMLREVNGEFSYPDININGGTWQGIPVLTSNNVPASVSAGSIIALVIASEVFLADEGGVQLDASEEASLQMDSAPTAGGTTTETLVSLWQNNLIGIRAERMINWQRRRDAAVGYIDNVHL